MEIVKCKPWGKDQGDYVLVNKSDFDAAPEGQYELYVEPEKEESEFDKMTVAELKTYLNDNLFEFDDKAKKADLVELIKNSFNKE